MPGFVDETVLPVTAARITIVDLRGLGGSSGSVHNGAGAAPGIWYVEPDGNNVQEMVEDARDIIQSVGLSWLQGLHDTEIVLRTLLTEDSSDALHGCGGLQSPMRSYVTAYVARRNGNIELAVDSFQHVLASGVLRHVEAQVRHDLGMLTFLSQESELGQGL